MNDYITVPYKLQFELSSMCNALCLGCVRTDTNTYNEKKVTIPDKQYISFATWEKILTAPEFNSVNCLEFCGTIDDPLMHPQLLEFLDFAASLGKKYGIYLHTNAGLRNTVYWKKLAIALQKHNDHMVKFSIDGLEDTNHIYRQNTVWSKIIENARAFIEQGGNAGWQYLVFPWNEHQINQAKELSLTLGFKEFLIRHDRSGATSTGLDVIRNVKNKNLLQQHHADLDVQQIPVYIDTRIKQIHKSLEHVVENKIECNNQKYNMYFIGFDSKLWPCCFIHNGFLQLDPGKRLILEKRLFETYGSSDWNDLTKHSVKDILAHNFYKHDLVTSWKSKIHGLGNQDRIFRCTEVCNVKTLESLPIGNYKIL